MLNKLKAYKFYQIFKDWKRAALEGAARWLNGES